MEVIQQLQQLGFTQYEAQAYVALLRQNPLNGYELAKVSGIPRANIYSVLNRLEDAGAVMRLDNVDSSRYAPVPAAELLEKLKRSYQRALGAASLELQQIATAPKLEAVLNFRGYSELLNQAQAFFNRAEHHLLISIWPEEAIALAEPLRQAQERGVQITTLCLRGCPQPCPACQGAVFRYGIAPVTGGRWLVVVADESELLAGEVITDGRDATQGVFASAVRTRQRMLVQLSAGYIQNSIALASILTGLGERVFSELDPQDIAALNRLHPFHAEGSWLDEMRNLLHLEDKASE